MKYIVNNDCVGCTTCVSECPTGAIVEKSDRCEVVSSKCNGCGSCVEVCPVGAIIKA